MAEVTALGVVVRIEQDLTHCPLGSFQRSHIVAAVSDLALIIMGAPGSHVSSAELELGNIVPGVFTPVLAKHP